MTIATMTAGSHTVVFDSMPPNPFWVDGVRYEVGGIFSQWVADVKPTPTRTVAGAVVLPH